MTAQQLEYVDALARRLNDTSTRVIDCRFDLGDPTSGRRAYEAAHIPGAVYADLDKNLSSPITPTSGRHPLPAPDDLIEFFAGCGIGEHSQVVVYDAGNGAMAARCWWLLRWLGHTDVRLLDGGFHAWCEAGNETEGGECAVAAGVFDGRVDWQLVIDTAELEAALPDIEQFRLYDARDLARFCGDVEPIDAAAGHIPGANNQPLGRSLLADGRWKPQEELESLWEETLGTDRGVRWSVMCGSGVTACHIALSAVQAGFAAPRLYAGSWSEWIRDKRRPIATGGP